MSSPRHQLAKHRQATALAFFGQGLVFIALTTKLPELQKNFHLSPGTFSAFMLVLVLCAGAGSLVGEKLAPRRGSAFTLRAGFLIMVLSLPLMAIAGSVPVLLSGMALYGLALGAVDAGTNMQGVALEHEYERPIMPTFFAAWTSGGVVGTLGALVGHNSSFVMFACLLALVPAALLVLPYLRGGAPVVPIGDDGSPVPWRRILPVGAAMVLFYMVDTAATTWGPTYLDHVFAAAPALVAIATLPYLVASLTGRALGDRFTARFGAVSLVRCAAVVGSVGLALVVFAGQAWMAMLGFCIAGLGIAVVAPLSFSAAASIARETVTHDDPLAIRAAVDAVIARFNQFNYVGGLLGAVLTGAVGNDTLRVGFAIPMVLVLCIAPLARSFAVSAPTARLPLH